MTRADSFETLTRARDAADVASATSICSSSTDAVPAHRADRRHQGAERPDTGEAPQRGSGGRSRATSSGRLVIQADRAFGEARCWTSWR